MDQTLSRFQRGTRGSARTRRATRLWLRRKPEPKFCIREGLLIGADNDQKMPRVDTVAVINHQDTCAHEGAQTDRQEIPEHCLLMKSSHYVVSWYIGFDARITDPVPVVIDKGSGHNVIRRDALPTGWEKFVTNNKDLP